MKLARKVLDAKYSSHLAFLVQVFVRVPWQERLHQALQLQPEQVVEYHSCFAELVMGLAWHPDMVEFVYPTGSVRCESTSGAYCLGSSSASYKRSLPAAATRTIS